MGNNLVSPERRQRSRGAAAQRRPRSEPPPKRTSTIRPAYLAPGKDRCSDVFIAARPPASAGNSVVHASVVPGDGATTAEKAGRLGSICLDADGSFLRKNIRRDDAHWNGHAGSTATHGDDAIAMFFPHAAHVAIAGGVGRELENTGHTGVMPPVEWRDSEVLRAALVLPIGVGGGGFVSIPYPVSPGSAEWDFLEVPLSPSQLNVVRALRKAYLDDSGFSEGARGRRCAQALADMIGVETGWTLERQTVTAYMSQIERKMQAALRDAERKHPLAVLPAVLIDRQRSFGARLAVQLELCDRSQLEQN